MSREISIKLEDVTISHPENVVFNNINLDVYKGDFARSYFYILLERQVVVKAHYLRLYMLRFLLLKAMVLLPNISCLQ